MWRTRIAIVGTGYVAAMYRATLPHHSELACQIRNKGVVVDVMAPDFSVGCLEYENGIVARVTCGLVAPRDKSLTIVGDGGIIYVDTLRNDVAPVYIRNPAKVFVDAGKPVDFNRGSSELAEAGKSVRVGCRAGCDCTLSSS